MTGSRSRDHRRGGGSSRPTAVERLAAALRDRILERAELAPGTPLREEELAREHEVSRHTARAALALLRAERLVEAVPYAGSRVAALDDADLVALQELRAALESEAVRLVTERHGAPWPAAVRAAADAAVERLGEAEAAGDWRASLQAHAAVHRAVVEAAGSPRIAAAHAALESEILLVLAHLRPDYPPGSLAEEHRCYLDELPVRGGEAVREHLEHSTALIRAARAGRPSGLGQ